MNIDKVISIDITQHVVKGKKLVNTGSAAERLLKFATNIASNKNKNMHIIIRYRVYINIQYGTGNFICNTSSQVWLLAVRQS
jgi:hypothetical protein